MFIVVEVQGLCIGLLLFKDVGAYHLVFDSKNHIWLDVPIIVYQALYLRDCKRS